MKIRPLGAELFYAEGRTDGRAEDKHDESNFANAPKTISRNIQYAQSGLIMLKYASLL